MKFITKYIISSIFLTLLGLGGIYYLVTQTLPTLGPRWLIFFFLMLAASGFAMPIISFLNTRFPSVPPVTENVIVRQALWFGVFMSTIAWLQLGRLLSIFIALFLAISLAIIEFLIRLREQSRWQPEENDAE